jgi:hypothetical protein
VVRKVGDLDDGYILSWQQGSAEIIELRLDNFTQGLHLIVGDPENHAARKREWMYIAATYREGDSARLYINGRMVAARPSGNHVMRHTDDLRIGGYPAYANEMFTGQIDQVRISSIARTALEIQNNYSDLFESGPELVPVPSPTYERRPVFQWHPVSGVQTYQIQVSSDPSFNSLLVQLAVADTAFRPLADLPYGEIFWRVSANPLGGLYSRTETFTIIDTRVPVLVPYTPDPTWEQHPTLTWHPVAGASTYQVHVSTRQDFSNAVVLLQTTDTAFTPLAPLPLGRIYWRVRSDLSTVYSMPDDFLIENSKVPALYRYNGAAVKSDTLRFRWRPVAGAAVYRIVVATDPSFSDLVITLNTADTGFTPLVGLLPGLYYWKVSCDLDYNAFSTADSVNVFMSTAAGRAPARDRSVSLAVLPNPFHSATVLWLRNFSGSVEVSIFSMDGKEVFRAARARAGRIKWDARGLPSGVYLASVRAGEKVFNRKVLLVR